MRQPQANRVIRDMTIGPFLVGNVDNDRGDHGPIKPLPPHQMCMRNRNRDPRPGCENHHESQDSVVLLSGERIRLFESSTLSSDNMLAGRWSRSPFLRHDRTSINSFHKMLHFNSVNPKTWDQWNESESPMTWGFQLQIGWSQRGCTLPRLDGVNYPPVHVRRMRSNSAPPGDVWRIDSRCRVATHCTVRVGLFETYRVLFSSGLLTTEPEATLLDNSIRSGKCTLRGGEP